MPLPQLLRAKSRYLSPPRIVFSLACICSLATAQGIPAQDSLQAHRPDSLQALRPDTLRTESYKKRSIPSIGNLGPGVDTSSLLHSHEFLHSDAEYIGDLLWKVPGVFLRELGQPGQPVQINAFGVDNRGISFQLDGRPLNDPVYGGYNLYDIPIEYVDEIETFVGSAALSLAPNSSGGTINFVSHQYNTVRPLTKLRFFQGPFDHILSDGIFAQDISRSMNAMLGFQRHVADGRFQNSAYDSWNFRFRLRYNVSARLNAWIGDFYTKSTIGLNGGLDPDQSPSLYDEVTAVVRDLTTYQISSRHDLTAGVVGKLLPDSSSLSKAIFYYSSIDREYTNGGGTGAPPVFSDPQGSSYWGTKLEQRVDFLIGALDLGAQYESRHVNHGHYLAARSDNYAAASAKATLQAENWLKGAFSTRLEKLRGDNSLSWGVNLESHVNPWLVIWGDQSKSYRFPTIQELFWTDSALTRSTPLTKETHSLLQVGIRFRSASLDFDLRAFKRRVENAIAIRPWTQQDGRKGLSIFSTPVVDYIGGTAGLRLSVWNLEIAGNLTFTDTKEQGDVRRIIPRITSVSELSFRDQFAGGELDLKAAIRLKAVSHHDGLQFIPQLLAYSQQDLSEMPGFTTVDVYCVARLGDAYLTFVWENPLNVNTMVVPFYPLMGRNIKLGVNWVFAD
ncbi:hypothetical protein D4R75_07770 [bacterium]|nr:MAG: hypothetical protein D4R75_07770 [bacterium]